MPQMPEAISYIIDSTEAYTNEIRAVEKEIIERQNWLANFRRRPNNENWPRIYMIGECVEPFSVSRYCSLGECDVDYDIECGNKIRFIYDYDTGTFTEDFNFISSPRQLFTHDTYAANFKVLAYVTLPHVVRGILDHIPDSDWPSELSTPFCKSWCDISMWSNLLPEGGKLYIVEGEEDV